MGPRVLAESEESRTDPLRLDAQPDSLLGEQTWPTEEELRDASEAEATEEGPVDRSRKLPAGVSDYQATWLGPEDEDGHADDDDDGEEEEDDDDEIDDDAEVADKDEYDDKAASARAPEENGRMEEAQVSTAVAVMRSLQASRKNDTRDVFAFLKDGKGQGETKPQGVQTDGLDLNGGGGDDDDEDEDDTMSFMDGGAAASPEELERERRLRKLERAQEDAEFPDEVDTPFDRPAKERFGRYRNLQSFRTSPWDPKESLPRDYARLFDFGTCRACRFGKFWMRNSWMDLVLCMLHGAWRLAKACG